MNRKHLPVLASSLGSAVVAVLLVTALNALADRSPGTDGVPRVIPYRGTLEQDGQPYDGGITMVFRLHDEAEALVFEEPQEVQVYQGRFSVLLGSTGPDRLAELTRAVTDADEVYLSIALRQGDGEETPLSNRQRFLPVPFALWATASTDLQVGNTLTVAGHTESGTLGVSGQASVATLGVLEGAEVGDDLGVGGALTVEETLEVGGTVATGGTLTVGGRNIEFAPIEGVSTGGIVAANGGGDILVLNRGGGFRDLWIEGDTLSLEAPNLRFRRDGQYLPALTLREDGLYLSHGRHIPGGVIADGNFTVTGSMVLSHDNFYFGENERTDGGIIARRDLDDALVLNAVRSFAGGTRIESGLEVRGALDVANAAGAGGTAVSTDANGNWLHLNQGDGFSAGTRVNGDLYSASSYMQGMRLWSSKLNSYVSVATWISNHCRLYFGHDDGCGDGCPADGENPDHWGWTNEHGCGLADGSSGECISARDEDGTMHRWLASSTATTSSSSASNAWTETGC